MSAFLNVNEIKEKVSLLELLKNLGFTPQKVSGGEHFFLSMLREEYTASLCVNDELGVWFDHGGPGVSGIRSGSVIDFGLAYWYPSGFPEVLHKIVEYAQVDLAGAVNIASHRVDHRRPTKIPRYSVERMEELGTNAAISAYLDSRGIGRVAKGHLYELYYAVLDGKNKQRNFFAAGWPNENGGWEVRNKYFKGCLGHKGVSFLEGSAKRLCVFEGYFDFLSWRVEHAKDPASILVLNSLSLLQTAKARAAKFDVVELYFDHDKAGRAATCEFVAEVELSRDCSWVYSGFKDYNEKLVASLNAQHKIASALSSCSNNLGLPFER
ncbi:toprim domain-containing protein [Pedobacter endophyticus]|uniref:Toprim domain-containing protein n=2 Tax=Pedobacter endophyticus TaxID=2789740 RepID=A0A7S9Q0N1_9SPHI|nr:toprim domain-containing protein [Pedobacter endophyticus]